jgi:hypothetical protein
MRKGFLIYEEMRKYFLIYEEAVSHILLCNCSTLNFIIYEENLIFFFISADSSGRPHEACGWPHGRAVWHEVPRACPGRHLWVDYRNPKSYAAYAKISPPAKKGVDDVLLFRGLIVAPMDD